MASREGQPLLPIFDCNSFQVGSLQDEIKGLKDEIGRLKSEVKRRDMIISSLKSDKEGQKKEIQERDETIQEKVCIYHHVILLASWLLGYRALSVSAGTNLLSFTVGPPKYRHFMA